MQEEVQQALPHGSTHALASYNYRLWLYKIFNACRKGCHDLRPVLQHCPALHRVLHQQPSHCASGRRFWSVSQVPLR